MPKPLETIEVKDQMGRVVSVPAKPERIISLVPSQTELLFDLGVGDRVVGVTKFCIHPAEGVKGKVKIGGTKNFNFEVIEQLKPDLIIGNKEENYEDGINQLACNYPVWMSDILTLDDSLAMITALGSLVGEAEAGKKMAEEISRAFANLDGFAGQRVAYFIWRKPYMAAVADTFIQDMLQRLNLQNVFAAKHGRYPEITAGELVSADPELVLLSSEPYPFKNQHIQEFRALLPSAKIVLVDGEMFSWYGSRLLKSPAYFAELRAHISA